MGNVGRPRKPDAVKAKQGTLRPSRVNANPVPATVVDMIPPAPEWLDEVGQAEWIEKTRVLHKMGILERADLTLLAAYCNEWSTYILADKEMRSGVNGRIYVVKDGRKIKYAASMPWVKIAKDALEQVLKIGAEFGFSPASRSKISIPKQEQEESKISKLLKGI
jgi:P27 family predicted phage terminase small subunit